MKLPFMTTHRWMGVVVAAAMVLWSGRVREHWNRCMRHARAHAVEEQYERYYADNLPPLGACGTFVISMTTEERRRHFASLPSAADRRKAALQNTAYHHRMKRNLEQSAWRPWEPLPIHSCDPPGS
jgi:hypothetical protein